MIKMTEIKNFYKERGQKITTEKNNFTGRTYKISNDEYSYSRSLLEKKYLNDSSNYWWVFS